MFKQRLRKWGCRKNISLKREDEETLRQLFQQGGGSGSGSASDHSESRLSSPSDHQHQQPYRHRPTGRDIQLANGQITTVDRLATHLRRKHDYYGRRQSSAVSTTTATTTTSSHKKQQQQQQLQSRPSHQPQQKLPTTPLIATLPDPHMFRVSEAVLFQVRTFIISRFADDDQRPQPLAANGPQLVKQWRSYSDWLAYCNRIALALRSHRLDEALREMRVGPQWITTILTSISGENQIPNVLGMLFYFLITVTRQTQTNFLSAEAKKQLFVVVRALVKYAAQASKQDGLPEIITRLLQSIWFVDDDEMLYDLSNKAWQMTCQTWGSNSLPAATTSSPDSSSSSSTTTTAETASWTNIFSNSSSDSSSQPAELLPRTDIVISSASSHLSRRTYAELLILHASYLHSAIAAQDRNPALDDRLVSIFLLVSRVSTDPSHLTSMYTQLMLAYHYRADWDAVAYYKPRLWWALRNAPNDFLRIWAVITVKGHVGKLTEMGEMDKAAHMAQWLAEMEAMQWKESTQVLTPPPEDFPEEREESRPLHKDHPPIKEE